MVNGIIDIGNTAMKIALFDNDDFLEFTVIEELYDAAEFVQERCEKVFIGNTSSKAKTNQLQAMIHSIPVITQWDWQKLAVNFTNYTFKYLGADRVANTVHANKLFPGENVLVIDIGTCITYDALHNNSFLAQGISPGLQLRLTSMNSFTSQLPLLNSSEINIEEPSNIEQNSASNMLQSVYLGTVAEINDRILHFSEQFSNPKVVLTGGDFLKLKKHIKISTFADPYWTLKGYNEILLKHL